MDTETGPWTCPDEATHQEAKNLKKLNPRIGLQSLHHSQDVDSTQVASPIFRKRERPPTDFHRCDAHEISDRRNRRSAPLPASGQPGRNDLVDRGVEGKTDVGAGGLEIVFLIAG